jgi:hypothetical protein
MTTWVQPVDAEDIAKEWLAGTSVAPLVMKNGKPMIFEAMPKGTASNPAPPMPVIVLQRVGGAPLPLDPYVDQARISFQVWAKQRSQAKAIAIALIAELESIIYTGPVDTSKGRLESATTVNNVWMPDPASDTSRYVVDALLTVFSVSD